MKISRDLNGVDLSKYLKPYGYIATRQTGSDLRLTTDENGQHIEWKFTRQDADKKLSRHYVV